MEWVEVTAATVEAAKDAALDRLGVDVDDAEFEILEEPGKGLFGRAKGQARVRARIRPTAPRPKLERRDRRQKRNGGRSKGGQRSSESPAASPSTPSGQSAQAAGSGSGSSRGRRNGARRTDRPVAEETQRQTAEAAEQKEAPAMTETVDVDLAEHTRIVTEFLDGLVDAFELEGRVQMTEIDEETNEVHIEGRDLGVLVGPRGATLAAIQELSRTVVHRKVSGSAAGRVRLDVAGYRARRREALERFTRELAEEVRSSGVAKALEPMGSADRKVVHDTVNELDGVALRLRTRWPRRRVVIVPA